MSQHSDSLVENLFRHEAGRMLSVLVRVLGTSNLDLAEDIVQDSLVRALETWRYGRLPENPAGWLMQTARNRALDVLRRERSVRKFAPDLATRLDSEWTLVPTLDGLFLESEIQDDLLRMMFSCCHPRLAPEVQATLILKILCGFGTSEIARAFLTNEPTIEKRLTRGKQTLRQSGTLYEITSDEAIRERLDSVLGALYLLFSEGYHGGTALPVREELCGEAIRLLSLLTEHRAANDTRVLALLALMHFHAARLPARLDDGGSLVLLEAQDRTLWNRPAILRGVELLNRASQGETVTPYHLEAAIAAEHCLAERYERTDWKAIAGFYDLLFQLQPNPIIALNRAIAHGLAEGPDAGLALLENIPEQDRLSGYPFFSAARGELHRRAGRRDQAAVAYREAIRHARSDAEAAVFRERLAGCE